MTGNFESGIPPWRGRGLMVGQGIAAHMVAGLTIMLFGVILLIGRFGLIQDVGVWRLWPVLLIGIGALKLAMPAADHRRHGGALVIVGIWLLLHELHIVPVEDSWPLLLVAFGVKIMWKALRGGRRETE